MQQTKNTEQNEQADASTDPEHVDSDTTQPIEIGGPKGPEPTRYGDWEKNGRCVDF